MKQFAAFTQRTEVCNKSFVVLSLCVCEGVCVCLLLSDILWNAFEMHLTNGQMRRGQQQQQQRQHLRLRLLLLLPLLLLLLLLLWNVSRSDLVTSLLLRTASGQRRVNKPQPELPQLAATVSTLARSLARSRIPRGEAV